MTGGHGAPSDWMVRHAHVHPPMVTWLWPGAAPLTLPDPVTRRELSSHLVIRHGYLSISHWTQRRLAAEHDEIHGDPIFGHIMLPLDWIHVHADATDQAIDDWDW